MMEWIRRGDTAETMATHVAPRPQLMPTERAYDASQPAVIWHSRPAIIFTVQLARADDDDGERGGGSLYNNRTFFQQQPQLLSIISLSRLTASPLFFFFSSSS